MRGYVVGGYVVRRGVRIGGCVDDGMMNMLAELTWSKENSMSLSTSWRRIEAR